MVCGRIWEITKHLRENVVRNVSLQDSEIDEWFPKSLIVLQSVCASSIFHHPVSVAVHFALDTRLCLSYCNMFLCEQFVIMKCYFHVPAKLHSFKLSILEIADFCCCLFTSLTWQQCFMLYCSMDQKVKVSTKKPEQWKLPAIVATFREGFCGMWQFAY